VHFEGFQQLKRVISSVPVSEFDMSNWSSCASDMQRGMHGSAVSA